MCDIPVVNFKLKIATCFDIKNCDMFATCFDMDVEQPLDQGKISEYIAQAKKLVEVMSAKVMAVTALVQDLALYRI